MSKYCFNRCVLLSTLLSVACSTNTSTTAEPGSNARAPHSSSALTPAELTPDIMAKSEELLKQHAEAPVGSEYDFDSNGQRYIARIEMHEDQAKGKHKGITVYAKR